MGIYQRFISICVAVTTLGSGSAFASGGITTGGFQEQVFREMSRPATLSLTELKKLQDTQFIFIDGIFGEFFQSNFTPARYVASEEWGSQSAVIFPKTVIDIPKNSETLYQQLKAMRLGSLRSHAVLVGHSKGAVESLLAVLHHPDLIRDLGFDAFVMVSSPIGGTDMVSIIDMKCRKVDHPACKAMQKSLPSLFTFTPDIIQPLFIDALKKLTPEDRALIEPKMFYIRTQMLPDDTASPLFLLNRWMKKYDPSSGENDGAVPVESQYLHEFGFGDQAGPVFGTDLGVVYGDHNSTLNLPKNDQQLLYRKSFFRVLTERVFLGH